MKATTYRTPMLLKVTYILRNIWKGNLGITEPGDPEVKLWLTCASNQGCIVQEQITRNGSPPIYSGSMLG